jgi:hypothetical protein
MAPRVWPSLVVRGGTGVETNPGRGQGAVVVDLRCLQVINDHKGIGISDFATTGLETGDFPVIDTDPGFEPLAVMIGQRDRCNRKIEQLAGNAGNAIKALAWGRVQQVKLPQYR